MHSSDIFGFGFLWPGCGIFLSVVTDNKINRRKTTITSLKEIAIFIRRQKEGDDGWKKEKTEKGGCISVGKLCAVSLLLKSFYNG